MKSRRKFIKNTGIGIAGFSLLPHLTNAMIPGDTVVELLQANPKDNGKATGSVNVKFTS